MLASSGRRTVGDQSIFCGVTGWLSAGLVRPAGRMWEGQSAGHPRSCPLLPPWSLCATALEAPPHIPFVYPASFIFFSKAVFVFLMPLFS